MKCRTATSPCSGRRSHSPAAASASLADHFGAVAIEDDQGRAAPPELPARTAERVRREGGSGDRRGGHAAVYHERPAARAPVGLHTGDERASRVLVPGLELRPTAARLVARGGAVLGIVAPRTHGRPRVALVDAGGGRRSRVRSRSALARVADPITSPDGEDTTRDAGATQLRGDLWSQRPAESVSPLLDAGTGEAPRRLVAPHTHPVARALLRTARTRRLSDFETSFNPLENDDRPR
jgi:hypothetical protein